MTTKNRWIRLLAVATALSMITLAGCGDDDADTTTEAPTTEAPTTTAAPTTTVAIFDEVDVAGEALTAALADWAPVISPSALFENLSVPCEATKLFVQTTRAASS